MSQQRIRLAKYLNKSQRFRGTFSEIRHDKNNIPEILFLDIYPIYDNGKKIPIRSRPALIGSNGEQIVADHVWVKLTPDFLKLNSEALYGDVLDFTATVESYKINRDNVLNFRDELWDKGKKASEEVYEDYRNYKHSVLEAQYTAMQEASQKVYNAYKKHLLTFQEMKREQKLLKRDFHKASNKAYNSMRAKQKRRINSAQKKIASTHLIDYGLTNLSNVCGYKLNHKLDDLRNNYDISRVNDLRYTKFLAWHSMDIKNKLMEKRPYSVISK